MANSIFSNSDDKKKEESDFKEKVDTHSKALLDVIQRQKDLESNLDLTNEKLELLDHNSIKNIKDVKNDMKDLRSDLMELKAELQEIKTFNAKVIKQMKITASKDEVTKLERYIDLWNPMNFVTREELEKSHDEYKEKILDEIKKILDK